MLFFKHIFDLDIIILAVKLLLPPVLRRFLFSFKLSVNNPKLALSYQSAVEYD